MSPGVVSDFDFKSRLALHPKQDNFNWQFHLEKRDFQNGTEHKQYIYIYQFKGFSPR